MASQNKSTSWNQASALTPEATRLDYVPNTAEAPSPAPRSSLNPRLQFIDEGGTDEDTAEGKKRRTAIRKHVMVEHIRQKRWQEKGQLDLETILQQRGLLVDPAAVQPTSANTAIAIKTKYTHGKRPIVKEEEEAVEEIRRSPRQEFLSQLPQTIEGKSPDEIDALLASASTDNNAFLSYFDTQQHTAPSQWQPPQVDPARSFTSSITPIFAELLERPLNPHGGSLASNNAVANDEVPGEVAADNSPSSVSEQDPITPLTPTVTGVPTPGARSVLGPVTPGPHSHLGGTRKDPFGALPLVLKEHEHELVDHFIMVMPFDYYGVHGRRDLAFNWFRDVVFPVAINSPISFRSAVLGFACIHKARLQKVLMTPELTYQGAQALRMLNERVQKNPDDCSDEIIANCLIQSVFEDFSPGLEHKTNSWLHMRAAMQMIRHRGGPAALQHNPRLTMLANCYDYRMPGYSGSDLSLSFKNYPADTFSHIPNPTFTTLAIAELIMATEEFIGFLRSIEHLSLVQRSSSHANLLPRRHFVFQPRTSLHAIIASPPAPRRSIAGYQHQVTYGLSLLLHLNAALWDFRRSPDLSERFLKELSLRIVGNELDTYVSAEALAQLLLRPTSDPDMRQAHFDRLWFVGRMIKVAKRLSLKSWLKLRGMLIGFLTFEDMPSFFDWEDEFRAEVLAAPLVSYVMPALAVPPMRVSPSQAPGYGCTPRARTESQSIMPGLGFMAP